MDVEERGGARRGPAAQGNAPVEVTVLGRGAAGGPPRSASSASSCASPSKRRGGGVDVSSRSASVLSAGGRTPGTRPAAGGRGSRSPAVRGTGFSEPASERQLRRELDALKSQHTALQEELARHRRTLATEPDAEKTRKLETEIRILKQKFREKEAETQLLRAQRGIDEAALAEHIVRASATSSQGGDKTALQDRVRELETELSERSRTLSEQCEKARRVSELVGSQLRQRVLDLGRLEVGGVSYRAKVSDAAGLVDRAYISGFGTKSTNGRTLLKSIHSSLGRWGVVVGREGANVYLGLWGPAGGA